MPYCAVALATILLAVGCGNGSVNPRLGDTDGLGPVNCTLDTQLSVNSAEPLAFGTEATGTFCPRRDEDFWRVSVAGSNQLVSAVLTYQKLSTLSLALEWVGPKGICMAASPTACTLPSDCGTGNQCDTNRNGCRSSTASRCAVTSQCGGENCTVGNAIESLLVPEIAPSAGTLHRIATNFPAFIAGDYVARVFDQQQREEDADTLYHLTLTQKADPDANEYNDDPAIATTLTSGTSSQGFLSYAGDIDYYTLTPSANQRVLTIELTWPQGQPVEPTFTATQAGGWSFPSTSVLNESDANNNPIKVRRNTIVIPGVAPVLFKIERSAPGGIDDVDGYTLTVTATTDPDEPTVRNDTPNDATVMNLAGTGTNIAPANHTLIAENDLDWYRIDTTGAARNLIYAKITAPANVDYLLQATFFVATANTCPADTCPAGEECITATDECIAAWVQRPPIDGPGDPQQGGLKRNWIETQLPHFDTGTGAMYLQVRHNTAAFPPIPGFSDIDPYTIELRHKAEPDPGDLAASPDNNFVPRPNQVIPDPPGPPRLVGHDEFFNHFRSDEATTGSAGSGTDSFVAFANGTIIPAGTCGNVNVAGFDSSGQPASGVTVTLSGSFVDNCTNLNPQAAHTISGTTGTISYNAPASPALAQTVSATVGGTARNLALPVGSAGTLTLNNPPRSMTVSSTSSVITVALPSAAASVKLLELTGQGVDVGCTQAAPSDTTCPNAASVTGGTACTFNAGLSTCRIAIAAGQTTYNLAAFSGASAGPVAMTIRDVSASNNLGSITWIGSVMTQGSVSLSSPFSVQGYISYEGDNDFFRVPLPAGFGKGWLDITLTYPASQVDLRVNAFRGGYGAGIGIDADPDQDQCTLGCNPGSCDNRQQCSQSAYSSVTQGGSTSCVYMVDLSDDFVEVWVNEVFHNDWDEVGEYQVDIQVYEGCPSTCDNNTCTLL